MSRCISYSAAELTWIKAHSTLPRREAHLQFCQAFSRSDVSLDNFKSLCKRNGWLTGRDGRLRPGNAPPNKGKKMPFNSNCARTQFKKGRLPHNTKSLGHERIGRDGYVWISVGEANPYTGYERRYVQKHRWLWEKQHGPVPDGMCLKCLDGNRQNTDPSNWELIPRAMIPYLNGWRGADYEAAEAEVKPAILTVAKLKYRIRVAREAEHG